MKELIIWVDENDQEVGYGEKMDTHKMGQLHRAFSIFIFDWKNKKMLLQKRAANKYHSAGLWSNACCSHTKYGEELWIPQLCGCMKRELGIYPEVIGLQEFELLNPAIINSKLISFVGKFHYEADYGALFENEIDYVFLYHPNKNIIDQIAFNSEEISELKWISVNELDKWLESKPEDFTAWFNEAYIRIKDFLEYERQSEGLPGFFVLGGEVVMKNEEF